MAKGVGDEPRRTEIPGLRTPPTAAPLNHGKTRAAWTTTLLVVLGGTLVAVGMILEAVVLIAVGAAAILLGLVAGRVMQAMGLGQQYPGADPQRDERSSPRG